MNVLVTGGAGYIGSHMVHVLKDKNIKVTVIDNLSTGNPSILPDNTRILNYNVGNIEAVTQLMKKEKFDAVIHFAASVVVPESVKNPLKYYLNNTKETINFIKACAEARVDKFIFSSTAQFMVIRILVLFQKILKQTHKVLMECQS